MLWYEDMLTYQENSSDMQFGSSSHNISQIQPTRYRNFDLQLFESQGENPEEAVCMFTEKKSTYMWTSTVQICCVQGSTVFFVLHQRGLEHPLTLVPSGLTESSTDTEREF